MIHTAKQLKDKGNIKKKLRLWGYSYATNKQIKTSTYDIISSD